MSSSDSIDGLGGTDLFVAHGVATISGAALPSSSTVKNIEIVRFPAQMTNANIDVSGLYTKATNGVTEYQFEDVQLLGATSDKTITLSAGQTVRLATGTSGAVTGGKVIVAYPATETSGTIKFNGYQWISGGTPEEFAITGAGLVTQNILSSGAHENKIGTFTGSTATTKHVITGDKKFTYALAAADAAALDSVDASGNTGGVNVDVSAGTAKNAFKFTGSSGNDVLLLIDGNLSTLTGSNIAMGDGTDKLGIKDTVLSSTEYTAINAVTGLEILGLNAAITLAADSLTSVNHFAVDTTGLAQSITGMKPSAVVDVGVGVSSAFSATSLTLAPALGTTALTVNVGGASDSVTHAVPTFVTTGFSTINLTSNGTAANSIGATANTNTANATFTLTGSAPTTLGAPANGPVAINGAALTGTFTAVGTSSADTITGSSTKANTLTGMAGGDTITVGSGIDNVVYTVAAETYATVFATGADLTTAVDKIIGMAAGDTITLFSGATVTSSTAVSTSLLTAGGTTDTIAMVRGDYNAVARTFTVSATGADTVMQWDSNGTTAAGNIESIVLVGYKAPVTGTIATVAANLVTLL
jgi:hypothetical protein